MPSAESTCWTVLREAAAGVGAARDEFAAFYAPLVRAYLAARWRSSPRLQDLDDAVQEVFVECLRAGGALDKADADRPGGFRAFLYGVVRHVAQRFEQRAARRREQPAAESAFRGVADDASLSAAFDRAWAVALMRQAAARQSARAEAGGHAARRRVELLHLRFHDGLPIREIARRWDTDAAALHHEYARARREFKDALLDVLAHYHPRATAAELEQECTEILEALGRS
jgi:RNA polymerase sigma factor (sigma-70 family)